MTVILLLPMFFTFSGLNTRLDIIINIGLQKGVSGPTLFSMIVLMAIVTTMMASPLFEIIYRRKARQLGELGVLKGSMIADAA